MDTLRQDLTYALRRLAHAPGFTLVAVATLALGIGANSAIFSVINAVLVRPPVLLNREPHLVVGVAPAEVAFPEGAQLWQPMEYDATFRTLSRGAWYLTVIGRLAPGASVEGAREELGVIARRLEQQYRDHNEGVGATARPLQAALVGPSRTALLVLLGAVGLVLLIACVNVANLLLARVAARETELAVRAALGAGRRRLVRQLLTESVVLSLLGGAAGVLLATASLGSLLALQPEGVPRLAEVRIDRAVMLFAAVLSLGTGLFFGVFPALHTTARPTAQALREGSRGVLAGSGRRLRGGLVVAQLALAMMLLAGAGLLLRSFDRLRRVDPGFRAENALTFRLSLPDTAYPEEARVSAFYAELQRRLEALPGVRATGAVLGLPLTGVTFQLSFEVEGRPPVPFAQQPSMQVRVATPGYLEAMGIPLRRGRLLEPGDTAQSRPVVVLSESAARRFFPDEDPIGRRITVGWRRPEGLPKAGGEIVGIVGDVRELGLDQAHPPEVYIPHAQLPTNAMDVVVRSAVEPLSLARSVERVVGELDAELPLARLQTLETVVARSVSEPRFYVVLLGAFAVMAVGLAALGIFGVMSYAVVQRSREIGIRVALGADPRDVRGMVLRDALFLTALGVGIGLLGALALSRVIASLLYELSPTDPATLAAVAGALVAVALLASDLPARRATRVDPLDALRAE